METRNSQTPVRPMIPLMRPLLVPHEHALPYLRQMDQNRWYSNFGPLTMALEARMAEMFGLDGRTVVPTSNGTSALVNIMRALNLPKGTLCLVPSWTFIATPASIVAAGLVPYFIDVDAQSWMVTPETAKHHLRELHGKVSCVMVVAPFGSPVDTSAWDAFSEETGVPVIIDAAAGFDSFSTVASAQPGKSPVMISLHATKSLGVGEGGLVVSTDTALISRIREMSNFGFSSAREISIPGTNGKMSEYTAAFAHAALDFWPQTRERWLARKWFYTRSFDKLLKPTGARLFVSDDWVSATLSMELATPDAQRVIAGLNARGIESRQWWGKGCHAQPAYRIFPSAPLPVTDKLGASVLALPFALDVEQEEIRYIMETLAKLCSYPGLALAR